MKIKFLLFSALMLLIYSFASFSQQRPQISFEDLMINSELDHRNMIESRKTALNSGIPINIFLEDGIFIEAKGVENEKPVYAVIKNPLHPAENGEVMFYEEILKSFNIENARINYGNGLIINPDVGKPHINFPVENRNANYLLVTESSNNRVLLFDFQTGDLIDAEFIPTQSNFILPKHAMQSPRSTISISDQSADVVFDYDTSGSLIGIFAPSIGPHNGILDNVRGHSYHPDNNHLVVCNAQGGNFNRIVEFDTAGNYLGIFITDNSGGLLGPFDIIFRTNDVFVTGSTSGAAHRYDYNGNYLDNFASFMNFPQQMVEFPNGNIGIATFGSYQGGLKIYAPDGTLVNDFNSVTGLRGVHYLGSGNIIVTNSAGVHEINGTTGEFVRTVAAGVSAQYVSACDFSLESTPVELTSFNASVVNNSIRLSWVTSSELNNRGFEIERSQKSPNGSLWDKVKSQNWEKIGFVDGYGTTTDIKHYSFEDKNLLPGVYHYRLKQIDFDGSYEYSKIVEVEVNIPVAFSLSQNYPNPFNPATTIEYQIPSDDFVLLTIYNSLGQEVSFLVSENQIAGKYSINFFDEKLPSGLYFYSLRSGDFKETRKMILLK